MTTDNHDTRITQLEVLFSEQEYTIETLNSIVTRQTLNIESLNAQLDLLKYQVKELKLQMPETSIVDEKPPHY